MCGNDGLMTATGSSLVSRSASVLNSDNRDAMETRSQLGRGSPEKTDGEFWGSAGRWG